MRELHKVRRPGRLLAFDKIEHPAFLMDLRVASLSQPLPAELRQGPRLVGFRPPVPYEVADYPAWFHRRFDGKPGMTGLWQVSGRNERSYEDMVRLDIEYLNRRSLVFDAWLLARTVGVVFGGRGAV